MALARMASGTARTMNLPPVKSSPDLRKAVSLPSSPSWSAGSTSPAEVVFRAELGSARAKLDVERLRVVAPYPFFGKPMCFQDEFSAMQITEDGRFYYSVASFDHMAAPQSEKSRSKDRDSKEASGRAPSLVSVEQQPAPPVTEAKEIITFEGTFRFPEDLESWLPQMTAMEAEKSKDKDKNRGRSRGGKEETVQEDHLINQKISAIEGHAIVRYEMKEAPGKPLKLVKVEAGEWKFAITVSPFFDPTGITILPLPRPVRPGEIPPPAPRRRQLPYIGVGGCRWEHHWGLHDKRERPRARSVVLSPLTRTRKIPQEKPPARRSLLSASQTQEQPSAPKETLSGMLRRLEMSASAPQLRKDETHWLGGSTLLEVPRQDDSKMKVAEWKQFYQQRAESLLWKADIR